MNFLKKQNRKSDMKLQEKKTTYAHTVNEGNFMAMRQLSWNVPDTTKSSKGEQLKNLCEENVDQRILLKLERKQKIIEEFADKSASGEENLEVNSSNFASVIAEEQEMLKEVM